MRAPINKKTADRIRKMLELEREFMKSLGKN